MAWDSSPPGPQRRVHRPEADKHPDKRQTGTAGWRAAYDRLIPLARDGQR